MASLRFPLRPLCVVLVSALILGLLFMAVYSLSHGEITYDPLYAGESRGGGGEQGCLGKGLHSRFRPTKDLHESLRGSYQTLELRVPLTPLGWRASKAPSSPLRVGTPGRSSYASVIRPGPP